MIKKEKITFLIFFICLWVFSSWAKAGQLGDWTTVNYLNVGRFYNVAVLANDTIIYTLGGFTYTTTPYPVEKTIIYPDGTLSSWSIDSQTMKIARCSPVGFFYNGYIYAFGGDAGPSISITSTAERSKVNSDGSLGAWEYINPLPKWLFSASLILSPPYIYIIGGWNATTENSNEILCSKIQSDGSLSEWSVLTSHLVYGRSGHSSILIDSTIYVIGGYNLDYQSQMNKFEKATINPDGELSTFEICGTTGAYHVFSALFHDEKYIYVIGGYHSGGNYSYRGERELINSNGSLSEPEIAPALQYETAGFGYVQTPKGCYVIGDDYDYGLVQYAPFFAPTGIQKKYWEVFENNE